MESSPSPSAGSPPSCPAPTTPLARGTPPLSGGPSPPGMAPPWVPGRVFPPVRGYCPAPRPRLERFMIPALDVLQSIPVLSFLPGVVLAMVALFPHREIGVELGSIVLIFTGQVWNLAFGFYSSVKSIPRDLEE